MPAKVNIDPVELRRLYIDEKLSTRQIGKKLGCHCDTVSKHLCKCGIPSRSPYVKLHLDESVLRNMYVDEKLDAPEIAVALGCSRHTVTNYLNEYKIPIRPQNIYCYDRSFFKSFTRESSYSLGCLMSDGCVYDRGESIYMDLTSVDRDWVELFRSLLQSDHPIIEVSQTRGHHGSKPTYKFRIVSRELLNDLYALGMTRAKSQSMKFPDIPLEFVLDFMRGYHDGDGSFFVDMRNRLVSSVVGTKEFLDAWCEKLKLLGMEFDSAPIRHGNNTCGMYIKVFTGKKAIEFAKLIYSCEKVPKMSRKYDIAKKFI
jgi:hypothetical protein